MNDASEVLSTIYDALIDQGFRELVTSCFGLEVDEFVECDRCLMKSHEHSYTQYFQVRISAATPWSALPNGTALCFALPNDENSLATC